MTFLSFVRETELD